VAAVCLQVRDQLEALVDGELGTERTVAVRAHLADCPACRAHHAEASSLPSRLAAMSSPEPSPALLGGVLRRVRRQRVGPLGVWGPLAVEVVLSVVALWYVSGLNGLSQLVERTASDVGAMAGWGVGEADLPAPAAGDVFLLLVCGLLLVTTVYHLSLLARQGPRLS
jgi:predicted anti-sigma-YlaC factor YlaD